MDQEERITKLEAARQLMEDSLIVHANLEARASTRLDKHQAILEAHEETMAALMNVERKITSILDRITGSVGALEEGSVDHEERLKAQEEAHEKFWRRHEIAMQEFDEKLNALISIVGNMQGGMESRPNN
jgi:hypothetical protein